MNLVSCLSFTFHFLCIVYFIESQKSVIMLHTLKHKDIWNFAHDGCVIRIKFSLFTHYINFIN